MILSGIRTFFRESQVYPSLGCIMFIVFIMVGGVVSMSLMDWTFPLKEGCTVEYEYRVDTPDPKILNPQVIRYLHYLIERNYFDNSRVYTTIPHDNYHGVVVKRKKNNEYVVKLYYSEVRRKKIPPVYIQVKNTELDYISDYDVAQAYGPIYFVMMLIYFVVGCVIAFIALGILGTILTAITGGFQKFMGTDGPRPGAGFTRRT